MEDGLEYLQALEALEVKYPLGEGPIQVRVACNDPGQRSDKAFRYIRLLSNDKNLELKCDENLIKLTGFSSCEGQRWPVEWRPEKQFSL